MWGAGAWGWGDWIVMSLILVGFWALVVFGIAAVFRPARRTAIPPRPRTTDPLQVLHRPGSRQERHRGVRDPVAGGAFSDPQGRSPRAPSPAEIWRAVGE